VSLPTSDSRRSEESASLSTSDIRINTTTMAVSQTAIELLKVYLLMTHCQFFLVQPSARELLVNQTALSTPPEQFPLSDAIVTRNQLLGLPERASLEPIKEGLEKETIEILSESASATENRTRPIRASLANRPVPIFHSPTTATTRLYRHVGRSGFHAGDRLRHAEEEPSCVDKDLQGVGYRMLVNQQPSAGR
jgi:hypothetical protein